MTEAIDPPLGATLGRVLLRPHLALPELVESPRARVGAAAMAQLGLIWSVLLLFLWINGEQPSGPLFAPIPRAQYYMWQGVLTTPAVTALWWIASEIAHRLGRALGGQGSRPGMGAALGFALAVPLLVHVLYELATYLVLGFRALAYDAKVALPLAALWCWVLTAIAVHAGQRLRWVTAIWVALVSLLVPGALAALLLR